MHAHVQATPAWPTCVQKRRKRGRKNRKIMQSSSGFIITEMLNVRLARKGNLRGQKDHAGCCSIINVEQVWNNIVLLPVLCEAALSSFCFWGNVALYKTVSLLLLLLLLVLWLQLFLLFLIIILVVLVFLLLPLLLLLLLLLRLLIVLFFVCFLFFNDD